MTIKRSGTVFISSEVSDKPKIQYCPYCARFKLQHILQKRVYKDHELVFGQLPHDHDIWLQCQHCWRKFDRRNVAQQGKLKVDIEIPNPSVPLVETGEHLPKPKHQRGFNERLEREPEIKDPELRRELKKGAKLISYSES